jgi:hypothetical protein
VKSQDESNNYTWNHRMSQIITREITKWVINSVSTLIWLIRYTYCWGYQRDNQKPWILEAQIIKCPNEKGAIHSSHLLKRTLIPNLELYTQYSHSLWCRSCIILVLWKSVDIINHYLIMVDRTLGHWKTYCSTLKQRIYLTKYLLSTGRMYM